MIEHFIEWLIIGVIVTLIFYYIAWGRKYRGGIKSAIRVLTLNSNIPPEQILKIIIQFAKSNGYKIDDFDENALTIVLSDPPSMFSWGYFYPIEITKINDKNSQVKIGIKNKLFGWDAYISRHHERCFNGIKSALFAHSTDTTGT